MTARYAQIHDRTVRDAFERYCAQRVNIAGEALDYDPDALTADAEWVKHNLSRIRDSLPNGYCGRPPQQDCPHPNACLTCPDFQTTPEFLDIHRQQADDQPQAHRPRRRQRPVPPRRQPPPRPRQPRPDHPRPRSAQHEHQVVSRADNTHHLRPRRRRPTRRHRHPRPPRHRGARPHRHAVTFTAVADAAGVSRSWLYNQPDLRDTITGLRHNGNTAPATVTPAAQRATTDSLRQRLDAARDEIARLRAENATLRDQLARSLGEQRTRR